MSKHWGPRKMGILTEAIKRKLEARFTPSQLDVQDQSHLHSGHGGAAEHKAAFPDKDMTAETHIHVVIIAEAFAGMSTLAKHRAVLEAVSEEVDRLHAFSLEAKAS
ncbi:MAG: BolA family protein [Litorimonas sp.]